MNLSAEQFAEILHSLKSRADPALDNEHRRAPRIDRRASVVITLCSEADKTHRAQVVKSMNATAGKPGISHAGAVGMGSEFGESLSVTVRNFSSRGIGILQAKPIPPNEQFVVRMRREGHEHISILCMVVHCRQINESLFGIGAEFTCILNDVEPAPQASAQSDDELKRIRKSILA